MAVNVTYSFVYDDYPRIYAITTVDNEEVSQTAIDIGKSYEQLSTETLKDFSSFLLEKFNDLVSTLILENLNSNKYSELVNPLKNICQVKTDCDKIIFDRENPSNEDNPFPPSM